MTRTAESILDEWLVLRCQAGEPAALGELLMRWRDRLLHRARSLLRHDADAADAAQEAMIGIARSIQRLDDPALFGPWALRILANKCADLVQQRQRSRRAAAGASPELGATGHDASSDDHQVALLRLAIETLPPHVQALLIMRYSREMGTLEIAAALGIREGTVKSRLHHARNELKSTFDRLNDEGA
jgi:RNA polymerase sigma-70 factor (ECF subfamily)